jgi:DNA-binding transcriptional LysR family regulator
MGELEDAGFIGKKLTELKLDTLASPQLLQLYEKPESPAALSNMPCLTGSVKHWKFQQKDNPSQVAEVQVNGPFSCKNGRALVQAAVDGNGIIRVPVMYCQNEIQQGMLISVFDHWQVPLVPFYAIYHKDKYQPARLRAFIDFISNRFKALN